MAAAQAFLNNRASSASLSSAAAAAALRSRPTTPISVADVQTKRTIRRAGSVNSTGSAGSGRPPLERRGSSGSMSERTFRDPSPSRSSQPVPSAADAPPVPALPKNIRPAIPEKSHRRASSMELSPARIASPPPNTSNGRGSSLGPARMVPQNGRAGQRDSSLSSLQERGGTPSHRGSVNFSLPTNSRPGSPIFTHRRLTSAPQRAKPPMITSPTNNSLVYDPNTRSFLPQVEVLAIEQRMYDAANSPVKKKKRIAPKQATGTHLADKTVGGRPRGTAIDAMEAATVHKSELMRAIEPSDRTIEAENAPEKVAEAPRRRKNKVVVSDSESDQASYIPNSSGRDSNYTIHAPTTDNRDGLQLAKKPSIVREDREREEEEDDTPRKTHQNIPRLDTNTTPYRTTSPPTLPRSAAGREKGKGHASPEVCEGSQQTIPPGDLNAVSQDKLLPANVATPTGKGSIRGGRVNSVSPARSTHFANSPSDNLLIKHQPPPRSISPRKSALKHAGAARGSSPLAFETNHGSMSNDSPEELSVPRKKANRVSFDETNVIVGPAAPSVTTDSPVVQSPQTRRSWFSISRGKKKEAPSFDDDDDEIMKPRPALPSFGSVREKKPQRDITPERPLIKPTMTEDHDTTLPSPPLTTPPTAEVSENPLGQSNDFIAGSILAQDAAMKNTANISKSREPLPPQVTSVEGNGYLSDTNSSITSRDEFEDPEVNTGTENGNGDLHLDTSQPTTDELTGNEDIDESKINGGVPDISITGATPTIEATEKMEKWPDMPGGWGDEHSDSEQEDPTTNVEDLTPATVGIAEPSPEVAPLVSPIITGSSSRHQTDAIIEESEESEGDSIYSDAAEDISDLDGDGFMSLDAVVESPIIPNSGAETALTTSPDSPTSMAIKERAYRQSLPAGKTDEQGWEKSQEYWKSLSSDKKKQLELEAEAESTPSPSKPNKKKTPVKPSQSATVTTPRQPAPNIQRTYMIAPGTKHDQQPIPLRSSMRAAPQNTPTETHIRKSMRSPGAARSSFRESEPTEQRGTLQKKHRPISRGTDEYKPDPEAVNAMMEKLTATKAAAIKRESAPPAPVRRRGSADSDSSFKRSNKASAEIPRFRSSMRGSTDQGPDGRKQSPIPSGRFSLRSMSPGSTKRRPFNSGGVPPMPSSPQPHMRNSMRNSVGAAPTLRGPPSRAKSPLRLPGFGRSSAKPNQNQTKRSGSRFDDSSDEEDVRTAFRSRFNDSSDEDDEPLPPRSNGMAKTMRSNAPVRGIPKRFGTEDGDSSDLPDSDDEKPTPKPVKAAPAKTTDSYGATRKDGTSYEGGALAFGSLRRSGSGRGAMSPVAANGPPTRPGNSRRGSFMSILRRKKADPNSKVRKSEAESPARRDTPLERSRSDLATLKALERPTSPKLQKRNPFERVGSGTVAENGNNWPLTEPPKIGGENKRPDTAGTEGGAEMDDRPGLGNRRHTATGLEGVDVLGVTAGKKKKKFGALRRMFRLDE